MFRIGIASLFLCLHLANASAQGGQSAGPYAGLSIAAAPGEKNKYMMTVLPDGRLVVRKNPDTAGTPIGRISGNEIIDAGGSMRMKFETDGRIFVSTMKGKPRFNADDEMLDESGKRMLWLTPDGTPMLDMNGTPGPLHFKLEGVTAENRRMAVLLTLFMMEYGAITSSAPTLVKP
jgi:hypothetical protein